MMTPSNRNRRDGRDQPRYSAHEVAGILKIPYPTVYKWTAELITPNRQAVPRLSFWDLVELFVLRQIRFKHRVPMKNVRQALKYVKEELGVERPLIDETFRTDGLGLYVDYLEARHFLNASLRGQLAFDAVSNRLDRIEWDPRGLAKLVFPWNPKLADDRPFSVSADCMSGRLVFAGTRISTKVICERYKAGDSVDALSFDYDLPAAKIELALAWEGRGQAA